jgi:ureidoglycolate hydrolase
MPAQDVVIKPILLVGYADGRFAPFGTCFTLDPTTGRIAVPLQFEGERVAGTSTLTIITAPFARGTNGIRRLERHPSSVQAFLPMVAGETVTIVAPPGEPPDCAEQLSAFVVPAGHGIAYKTGTWHSGLMGFETDMSVATFIRRIDDGSDTEFLELPFTLHLADRI